MGRRIPKPGGDGAMVEPGRCADRCASRPVSYPNLVILPSWLRACILVFRPWSGMAASPYSTTHPHDPHDLPQTAGRPHASEALGPEVRSCFLRKTSQAWPPKETRPGPGPKVPGWFLDTPISQGDRSLLIDTPTGGSWNILVHLSTASMS